MQAHQDPPNSPQSRFGAPGIRAGMAKKQTWLVPLSSFVPVHLPYHYDTIGVGQPYIKKRSLLIQLRNLAPTMSIFRPHNNYCGFRLWPCPVKREYTLTFTQWVPFYEIF